MIRTNLLEESDARKIVETNGNFSIIEYERDISVTPEMAETAYFASMMGTHKRQLMVSLSPRDSVIIQKKAMQLLLGDVKPTTDVSGVGDMMKKFVGSRVTGETAIKPRYTGPGTVVLEPTFRYILLENLDDWNGSMMVEDGMFLACQDTVSLNVAARTNVSSALLGGEGLFNTSFGGKGIVALESPVPRSELIEIQLVDDVVRIDGNMAIVWSSDLQFTVERTTPTLVGSALSGEGLVNVYRGTGKIYVAPVQSNRGISSPENGGRV